MSATLSPLPVVCALIERDGHVLIAQRPPHKHLALVWEFPGGKIEPGETPADALRREIEEELQCQIIVGHALPVTRYAYPTLTIELHGFVARLAKGSPQPSPTEHCALAWIEPHALREYELAPADLPLLTHYLRHLSLRPA